MKHTPFFSIVIPTLNEEKYLPLLLEDLTKQSYQDFEVLHIDGISEDKTISKAKEFQDILDVTSHVTEIRNVSHQRNIGAQAAKGTWIIFMDADNRLPTYFLDGIRYKIAKKPDTELFTTWVSIDSDKSLNQPIEQTINFGLEAGRIVGKEWSVGALIGIKKSILTDEYLFDTKQKVAEDTLFVKKLVDNGYIFNIFREPKYSFSIRRLESQGTVKIARSWAKMTINYFLGKDFTENDFGYKMEGGASHTHHAIEQFALNKIIKSSTKKQLQQAKKLLRYLTRKFDL